VADAVSAPADIPDLDGVILPSRACLLSVRDVLAPARRLGLEDAVRHARETLRRHRSRDEQSFGALECLWEATCCLELAATVGAAWIDPQLPGVAHYVEMTHYDPGRANRFYESSPNWTDERFRILSGHRFHPSRSSGESLLESLAAAGMVDERLAAAFEEAEAATARFLRERFVDLAGWWKSLFRYAHAYEHAGLLIPADLAQVIDDDGEALDSSFTVWESRKDAARGSTEGSVGDAVAVAEAAGELALDLAYHVADARLRLLAVIDVDDGQARLRPWVDPFPFWCHEGDLSPQTLEIMQRGVVLGWVREEHAATAP
jgi:hypothetical protein